MGFAWNWFGAPGVLVLVIAWALAALVYFARPRRAQNRRLALVLFLDGASVGTGLGLLYMMTDREDAAAMQALRFILVTAVPWMYLRFLATLDSPLVGPFRGQKGDVAIVLGTVGALAYAFSDVGNIIEDMRPTWYAPWECVCSGLAYVGVIVGALAFGLIVAISAYRRAPPGTPERRQAKWYALAFGTRDSFFVTVWVLAAFLGFHVFGRWPAWDVVFNVGQATMTLVCFAFLSYGILKEHLFEVQVRIKWTIRQSTIAAAFVAIYVIVSQGAQTFLAPRVGPFLGVAAAALLVLAIVPVQRFAERVANRAMPNVDASPEALSARKLDVYRAALERAAVGGAEVSEREAGILASLRAELGITEREHAVAMHMVRSAGRPPPGVAFEPGALILGKYRVLKTLGEGGAAVAYLAEDDVLKRRVVIKAFRHDPGGLAAVVREARAIAAVAHPNVVTIFDVEQVGDEAFIVMEHMEGGSLADRAGRRPVTADEFRRVATGTLAALEAVHAAGLVHRDVKPSNVLLARDGAAKLADFGIAHLEGFEATRGGEAGPTGTIRYMSPEQARGKKVGPRSDLYSAAATLYEAFTGTTYLEPREDETPSELLMRAAKARAFPRAWEGPPALAGWFAKALQLAPERRFASAKEMREAVEDALAAT